MITLNFDLNTGLAKLSQTTIIKRGAVVPVRVVFSSAPGNVSQIQLALGSDTTAPALLAYTEDFAEENDLTWTAVLNANSTELSNFMTGNGPTPVNLELAVTIDGERQVAPNLSLTVQPTIIPLDPSVEIGPEYYTKAEVNEALAAKAALTVAGKYRFKDDGTFQLWNATQSKWHTLALTGAAGAELLTIGAGE